MEDVKNNTGSVVSLPHPLTCLGRQTFVDGFLEKETLGAYVKRLHVNVPAHSFRVLLNGIPIPDNLWKGIRPRTGDNIIFQSIVDGSGGGNKILRTVALIVVAILSAYTGGAAGVAFFGSQGVASFAAAAVMLGGTLLVNALIPLPTNNTTCLSSGLSVCTTYSLKFSFIIKL